MYEYEEAVDPITGEYRFHRRQIGERRRKRPVARRVKRWQNLRGFAVVNDPTALLPGVARIVRHYAEEATRERIDGRPVFGPMPEDFGDWFSAGPEEAHPTSGVLTGWTPMPQTVDRAAIAREEAGRFKAQSYRDRIMQPRGVEKDQGDDAGPVLGWMRSPLWAGARDEVAEESRETLARP